MRVIEDGLEFAFYTMVGCFVGIVLLVAAMCVAGCSRPPIYTAATVSHSLHVGMDAAGAAIEQQSQRELDRCADTACVTEAGARATQAASVHDAIAPAVDAYRDEVLRTCGVDPSDPQAVAPDSCPQPPDDVWARIERLGAAAIAGIPDVIAALRAYGVAVPAELNVGGGT